jgi:hypothetical protein
VTGYTPHQSTYLAYRMTLEGRGEDAFAKSLSSARVETKPHQVDSSLFALHSPLSRLAQTETKPSVYNYLTSWP